MRRTALEIKRNRSNRPFDEPIPAWAGGYGWSYGTDTHQELHLAPKTGALYLLIGCDGTRSGAVGEIVESSPDRIGIHWGGGDSVPPGTVWHRVTWGTQRLLVSDFQMESFCNWASMYGSRIRMSVPTRLEDRGQRRPGGLPVLPAPFDHLLCPEGYRFRVLTTDNLGLMPGRPASARRAWVTLAGGSIDGAFEGLSIEWGNLGYGGEVTIVSVAPHTCTGTFIGASADSPLPRTGDELDPRHDPFAESLLHR